MRRRSRKTLRDRVELLIARMGDDVFLTREFARVGGKNQVIRVLRELIREGRLIRLGYGVYARAEPSRLSGRPALIARDGFAGASREALTKLGVDWEFTEAERAYNEGRSTQVPANAVVRVKGRFARRLSYAAMRSLSSDAPDRERLAHSSRVECDCCHGRCCISASAGTVGRGHPLPEWSG